MRLNWQLYRLCLVPVLAALVLAAFSLGDRASPLTSTLSPEAFDGARAFSLLHRMVALSPSRAAGSEGDARLLRYVDRSLRALGGASSGGYSIAASTRAAQTPSGLRELVDLIATRPGASSQSPIVLIAHRDSAQRGAPAQLSGTAALLELARVLANAETQHPVAIVFSDGGSAGASGVASLLRTHLGERVDAAIVLGDLAGRRLGGPLVQPFSSGDGSAPETLQRTVSAALKAQLGLEPGSPSLLSQLAHLAFPLTAGEQGPLNASGIPAVSVGLAGERGPSASEPVSEARLQSAGRAVIAAFYALDHAGEISSSPASSLSIAGRTVPAWALTLLILTLLLGPLLVTLDAAVRLLRRRDRAAGAGGALWLALSCGVPFLLCAVTLKAIAAIGILHAPANPAPAASLSFGPGPVVGLLLGAAALALSWRLWLIVAGRRGAGGSKPASPRAGAPRSAVASPAATLAAAAGAAGAAGAAAGIVAEALACLLALLVWIVNPYAALLLVPALHIWLLLLSPQHRPPARAARLAVAIAPLFTVALLILFYATTLGLGPAQTLLSGALLLGGGYVGWGASLLWSVALGLLVAIALASLAGDRVEPLGISPTFEGRLPQPQLGGEQPRARPARRPRAPARR